MTLTQEMKESIDNYGERIVTLENFAKAVRLRPGMYIGSLESKGLLNMIREIAQNSLDQMLDKMSPCDWFQVVYDERTLEVTVTDNGLGFPFQDIYRILTTNHTSKNFEAVEGDFHAGMNGSGSKVVNALSSTFIVRSYRYDGTAVEVEFHVGKPTTEKPKKIPNKEKRQGASVYFIPDPEIMGEMNLDWVEVYTLIKNMMSLTPIGSKMRFEAYGKDNRHFIEDIVNKDGIITNIIQKCKFPIIKPIVISNTDNVHKLDLAFCFDGGGESGPDPNPSVTAFANFCPTVGGTHIDGSQEGIARWFTNYMNGIYLANSKTKLKIVNSDVLSCGLCMMISGSHINPNLIGQSKEILSNPDMKVFCKDTVMAGLDQWSKQNPQDLAKIAKFIKEIGELRARTESSKQKIATKYSANPLSGLPAKYIRPLGKKDIELFIVEGDSALGSAELARDKYHQGLFPIRGKIINAFKSSQQAFFSNEEVQGINRIILGGEYKRNFELDDLKVSKVIFMADGDVDGAHISALLLRMFIMYYPKMIEAGMVYKAMPPLFGVKQGKKNIYFTEQSDITKFMQKSFLQSYSIADVKGKQLTNAQVTTLFVTNIDYTYYLEDVSVNYAVDPTLLEMVLYNYIENKNKINVTKLKKTVTSKFRFMDVIQINGITVVQGTIDKSNTVICHDKLFQDCATVLNILNNNLNLHFKVNNNDVTLYELMKMYENSTPKGVSRYKGLGEMDFDELKESTMSLDGRTLIRYTLTDAKQEIQAIREYESNPKKILSLVNNVTREDLQE